MNLKKLRDIQKQIAEKVILQDSFDKIKTMKTSFQRSVGVHPVLVVRVCLK